MEPPDTALSVAGLFAVLMLLPDPLRLEAVKVHSVVVAHAIVLALAFALVTVLHWVAGELVPRALALDRAGQVALGCAPPLRRFARGLWPILVVLWHSVGDLEDEHDAGAAQRGPA